MRDPSFAVLRPGALFCQRYHIVRCLKAGGMGAVYEVTDERTDGRRALKVMLPEILEDSALRERFAQEARITAAIESEHIVHVSDAGVDPETNTPFLVMDLLRGEDLGSALSRRGALPPREVLTYLAQVALGLDRTHEAGIVHRDLKPENLFITRRDDGSPCVRILDYGIAKATFSSTPMQMTRVMGTPLYMSPEQVEGSPHIGPRADLYALGHIAYTLLVGEPYWKGERDGTPSIHQFFSRVREGVREPPSARARRRGVSLPTAFDAWFLKATALSPEDRFERATEAIAALRVALQGASFEGVPFESATRENTTLEGAPLVGAPLAGAPFAGTPARLAGTPARLAPIGRETTADERQRIGPYRLIQELGRGGFGRTWLAEEVVDNRRLRDVALKLFELPEHIAPSSPASARWYEQILEEARALCRVEHPHVVRFYALHQDLSRGLVALAMEYVAGKSLDVLLREAGKLDERVVIDVGVDIAWALAAIHDAGLVHRDVKPSNVIQSATGYKLIDFGIAVAIGGGEASGTAVLPGTDPGRSLATAATIPLAPHGGASDTREVWDPVSLSAGTPGFVAPECLEQGAPPSPATDLYALGVTLSRLLTGDTSSTSRGTARLSTEGLPDAPRREAPGAEQTGECLALADVIALLLEADPGARPRHASWVAWELERARARLLSEETSHPSLPVASPPSADASTWSAPAQDDDAARGAEARGAPAEAEPPKLCPRPPLIGRDAPLGVLFRAAQEVKHGGVRVALITGPQGIGRTRLLEDAIEQAGFDPARVRRASASPERRSPLRPLQRAFEGAMPAVREAIEQALAPAPPKAARDAGNEALLGVEEALLCASAEAPLLLALDDLQWGDVHTLDLLRLLIDRADEGRGFHLLVVAALRNEPSPTPALGALLRAARGQRREGVKLIALGPLGAGDAAILAQSVIPVSPELERAVVRGSGGVPFFVVHALQAYTEIAALTFQKGAYRPVDDKILAEDVPGVGDLLEARIASYFEPGGADERAALRALAAIALYGGGLGIEVIFRVVGGDPSIIEAALETLVSAEILTLAGEAQEYSFAQEMVRQAALHRIRQRPWFYRLHRALLDAVAEGAGGPPDAAFLSAGYEKLGARKEALVWLERAMQAASRAGLFVEAAELGDRRAALLPEPEARMEAALDVAHALIRGWRFEEARLRLARIEAHREEGSRASDLRRRIYRLLVARALREPEVSDAALIADADAHGDAALSCEARMALAGVSAEGRAMQLAGEAIALAERLGPHAEYAARSLRMELNYTLNRRDLRLAEADLKRALALAAITAAPWQQINIEGDLAVIEAELGELDRAIERLTRLIDQARALGIRWQTRVFLHNIAAFLLRAGRDAEAAGFTAQAAELALEAGDPVFRANTLSLRADALSRLGDLDAALASVEEAERLQRQRGERSRARTLLRRAQILAAMGREGEALTDARAARDVAAAHGDQDLALRARLWEKLHLARRGQVSRAELTEVLAAISSADVSLRALTVSMVAEANAWLAREATGA